MTLTESLHAAAYVDPEIYERERHAIFRTAWVMVAYRYQFARPGDYVTEDVAGWSIFLQQGDDGVIRGFHNVCPHRAGPIVWQGSGCQANLVCRYHGWAFDQTGALRNARDFGAEDVGETLPCDIALTTVRVQEWRGFLFVCLDESTPDLIEWLGDFPTECAEYGLEQYEFHRRTVHPMQCNWKTYADNFLEGYHVPLVHPGLNREVEGTGYRVVTKGDRRWNLHIAKPRSTEPAFTGVFTWFWPNFSLNIFAGGLAVERWLPRGPLHSDLIFDYFFLPNTPGSEAIIAASEEVGQEDVLISEAVQRNLASGAYRAGYLSPRHENGLADFKELWHEVLNGEPLRK